ncbi:hypothetical protein M9H77_25933 [Catharanthus roseus]|uniref:Uncharacterized protein n=1 Tax=Catharanthus roseus TaxID=4058 RepID=A0ACC0AA39_CATRO|nr:hypothetical protein M9H77_25933 [Catharanthus roseus]
MTDIALAGLQDKYSILDECVLLRPGPDARPCSPPPWCYCKRVYFLFGRSYFGFRNGWRAESLDSDSFPCTSLQSKRKCASVVAPELINAKNAMMREHDMNPQRVYELETELKELESNFASLGEWCQLAESFHDAKERELANIVSKVPLLEVAADEKERDLQKKLLKCFGLQRLLGLVINREGRLNSHLVRGICERLIWTTHM